MKNNLEENDGILVIVDVQKEFQEFIPQNFVQNLAIYAKDFPIDGIKGVYQVWDSNKTSGPSWKFPNQVDNIEKNYGTQFDKSIKKITNWLDKTYPDSEEGQVFKIKGQIEYMVRVKNNHNWFFVNKELYYFMQKLKGMRVVLVGGADQECLKDLYVAMKAFGVKPMYNHDFIYSAQTNNQQVNTVKED